MSQTLTEETDRVLAMQALQVMDTEPEPEFEAIVQAAAEVCGVPISLISLIDADRQWFKANVGLPAVKQTPREVAFCSHTIEQDEILEISDASADERFCGNPLVTGSPHVRFYAGVPLRLQNGCRVGSLCVIDRKPRHLSASQRSVLTHLSRAAAMALESRRAAIELKASESRFRALCGASPMGVFAADVQGGCTYTNDHLQSIFGMSREQVMGLGWSSALHPEDKDAVLCEWGRAAKLREDFDMEFRILQNQGDVLSVRAVSRPVFTNVDTLVGFVGSIEDITERQSQLDQLRRSEDLLKQTGSLAKIGGWEFNLQSGEIVWSDQTCLIHGLAPGFQPHIETAINFYVPEDQAMIRAAINRAVVEGRDWDLEARLCRADGTQVWVRVVGKVCRLDGKVVALRGAIQDITHIVVQRTELAEQHERLHVTLKSIEDAVITTNSDAMITWLNPAAEKLTGWCIDEAEGKPVSEVYNIVHDMTRAPKDNPVNECLRFGKSVAMKHDTLLLSRSGCEYGVEDSSAPIRSAAGEVMGVVLVFHDVTEQRQLAAEMNYRATHDELTGLVNRSEFELRLKNTLNAVQEGQGDSALMFIDLDQFKLVNDSCGHPVGDELLQQMAKLLAEPLEEHDTLARLGGDEFGVILNNCSEAKARRVAQAICDRMDDFRFVHNDRRFRLGTSIGLVNLDKRWSNIAAIMQAADSSCYAAKEAGRNRVHQWFDTDKHMSVRRGDTQWAARLEQSLDENRFVLFGQRMTAMDDEHQGLQAEVLLRLKDDQGELVAPGAFLPAAERFHMASRIDRWVLQESIATLSELPSLDDIGMLWINLSGHSVGDRDFHRDAFEMLDAAGPEICQRLCFEITETAAVTNIAEAVSFITELRKLRVSTALDDFGAGAASFGYLKNLPVDILKIDGQFISNLITDPLDEAAVRCFVDVADVIGLKTVAEHVDTPAVLKRVRELGIDYAQGFMLHDPEPLTGVLMARKTRRALKPNVMLVASGW